jgi:hypothetical protein
MTIWKKDYSIKRQTIMIKRVAIRSNNSRLQLMTMMMTTEIMDVKVRKKRKVEIRIYGC